MTYTQYPYNTAEVTDHVVAAATSNTITLAAGDSKGLNYYTQMVVSIISGTGAGQKAYINAYNNNNNVATLTTNWSVVPDTTSHYTIYKWPSWADGINLLTAERMDHLDSEAYAASMEILRHEGSADHDGRYFTESESDARFAPILNKVPAGTVAFFAASTAPAGWFECNAQAVSRTTYSALFAVIGTTYGSGDGVNTFNVPDTRGYFPRFWSHGANYDTARTLGSTQADQVGTHTHGAGYNSRVGNTGTQADVRNSDTNGTISTTANSTDASGETRPKNIAFMGIIKY